MTLSVFLGRLEPSSESEIGFADTAKQIRPELFAIALLEHAKIEWRGSREEEHVLEVAVIVALELTKRDVVGIHHEEVDVFEEAFINRREPLLVPVRDLGYPNEIQIHAMLPC